MMFDPDKCLSVESKGQKTQNHSIRFVHCPCRHKETVIPTELPLVQEVTTTLREWATIWRDLYVVSERTRVHTHVFMSDIIMCRYIHKI